MDRLVYFVVWAIVAVIRALPVTVCFALGQAVGALMWAILPGYRRLAEENLQGVFENEKSMGEIRRLAFQHFTTLGANFCCAFKMAAMTQEEVERRTTVENFEVVNAALDRGKGVVCAYCHMGNWEIFAQRHDTIHPYKAATIYQAIRNKDIDNLINENRRNRGVETFNRKQDLGRALSMLRKGNMIVVLADQHAGDAGVWTPFFDRIASTSPLAASLAVKTGASVIPVGIFTSGFARWRLVAGEEVPYDPAQPNQLTADINRALEKQIRESPADWFWVHNRWKMPHPQFLLHQTKRGLFMPAGYDAGKLRPFRILIRSADELGDAVSSSLAIRAIKQGRPDARVTLLAPEELSDFWSSMPEVDDVITIREDESVREVAGRIRNQFEVAILFSDSERSAREIQAAGIRRRVGYAGQGREKMLNQVIREAKKGTRPAHRAERYLRIAEKMGAPSVSVSFPTTPLRGDQIRIGICADPSDHANPSHPERFREMLQKIHEQVDGTFVLLGAGGNSPEPPMANDLLAGFTGTVENRCGQVCLAQRIETLRSLRVVVAMDAGTIQLAAYLGVPVVAILAPDEATTIRPLGGNHVVLIRPRQESSSPPPGLDQTTMSAVANAVITICCREEEPVTVTPPFPPDDEPVAIAGSGGG